jgi:pimeloyl-ACP methyl ester carboxylesterase
MSLYKTEKGKKEIHELYDEKLKHLHIDYVYQSISTSYGETNTIICGDNSKPPILLIHGSNGCAPIAIETYFSLINHFRIYAVDVLAQPNKSAETRLNMKDDSYGKWMHEVIDQLELSDVTLAGFSFGGLIILKTLEFDESKIKEVYLSAPAYIVNGNPFKALFKVFIPMKKYMRTENKKYIEKFLAVLFTDRDEFAIKYLSKVFTFFKMDFSPVPVIKTASALNIKTPITLFAADNDLIFPGKKMISRALKIFPSLKSYQLLANSKHVQSKAQNEQINRIISNRKSN